MMKRCVCSVQKLGQSTLSVEVLETHRRPKKEVMGSLKWMSSRTSAGRFISLESFPQQGLNVRWLLAISVPEHISNVRNQAIAMTE
ncbi:hypothetical protein ACFX15_005234 [Malus domestica]